MKRTAFFTVLFLLLFACDSNGGVMGPGGNHKYNDAEREYYCNLAEDMMRNPAKYDTRDPTFAYQQGLNVYNDWQCGGPGEIRSDVQEGDTL